jgi:hypothetical protein
MSQLPDYVAFVFEKIEGLAQRVKRNTLLDSDLVLG